MTILYEQEIVVASLCGALTFLLTQHRFNRRRQPVAFFISFTMGLIGADMAVAIIETSFHGTLTCGRDVGAFLCSALIITLITSLVRRISLLWPLHK